MFSKKRVLTITQILILASSLLLIGHVKAADDILELPPTTSVLIIEVSNGTQSYFDTKLSKVPGGYDVTNQTYLGWCIDVSTEMPRSPATHTVVLYSSLSPPGDLADEEWNRVNYILNHKKGDAKDIQEAIWYFINLDGEYSPKRSVALTIIDDAEANGTNYIPTENQIAAVIAYPVAITNPNEVQISIIEVTVPQSNNGVTPTPTPTYSPYSALTPSPHQTALSPSPTSQFNSSPTPTSQEPNQTSPTPSNEPDGEQGSQFIFGSEAIAVSVIVALILIIIAILLYLRRRKKNTDTVT